MENFIFWAQWVGEILEHQGFDITFHLILSAKPLNASVALR